MIFFLLLITFYIGSRFLNTKISPKVHGMLFIFLPLFYFFSFLSICLIIFVCLGIKKICTSIFIRRKKLKIESQSVFFLDAFSNNLKAGLSREQAFLDTFKNLDLPLKEEFKELETGLNHGDNFSVLLKSSAQKSSHKFLKQFLISIAISLEMGQGLNDQIEKLLDEIRASQNIKAKLSLLSTQSQMQAYVCIILPILFTSILYFIAPGFLWPLFHSPLGHIALSVSFILLCLGGYWILKIANKDYIR